MNKFALGNQEQIFIKKETVEGTAAWPDANCLVLAIGAASTEQTTEFIPDAQIRARRSRMLPIKGRTNTGSWSFSTYVKPSGTPGTAPETDVLFECGLGKKAIVTDTSVTYSLDSSTNLPSFTMVRKVGHVVFTMVGCTVEQAAFKVDGNAIAEVAWSGQFMKWYYAGTGVLMTTTAAPDTHIHVDDAYRYTAGSRICIAGRTSENVTGFLINSVNYSGNILNLDKAVGGIVSSTAAITPWFPASGVESSGQPVHGKLGIITIGGTNAVVLTSQITLKNNIKYYTDMKNGKMYPTIYGAPSFRDVQGTMSLYFYKNAINYFYRSDYQTENALVVPAGVNAGKIMTLNCPYISYQTPKISGAEEIMVELAFTALGSTAGDDEFTVVFT